MTVISVPATPSISAAVPMSGNVKTVASPRSVSTLESTIHPAEVGRNASPDAPAL
jgi:hypothetical protein